MMEVVQAWKLENYLVAYIGLRNKTVRDTIIQGDALTILKTLSDGSIDCVVTSPPYWGLRDYGVSGQLGLEPTIEEYISNMTEIFGEVKRVLKDTGSCWINMGDCYSSGGRGASGNDGSKQSTNRGSVGQKAVMPTNGLKVKELCGLPWRLAFSLQADGWYLRSDIIEEVELYCPCGCGYILEERIWRWSQDRDLIWKKPNPMPESVTDRPTKSHEYLFLLTKKAKYFYDADAVRDIADTKPHKMGGKSTCPDRNDGDRQDIVIGNGYRNKRTVWNIVTQPYPEAHFATFPEKLVEPCIRAGTSERGNCTECGKPWVRVVEKPIPPAEVFTKRNAPEDGKIHSGSMKDGEWKGHGQRLQNWLDKHPKQTTGWQPSCTCHANTVQPIVLDPFMGSGTVGLVAKKLNRDYLGIELNPEYIKMAEKRIRGQMGLFVRSTA